MSITLTLKCLVGLLISSGVVLGGVIVSKPELGDKTIDIGLDKDGLKISKCDTSIETKE